MVQIILIRHALTDSVGKRLSGRMAGIALNEDGKKQAHQLAKRMEGYPIDLIYSSPLQRAHETALHLAQSKGLEVIVSDDFMEIDFGKWTNKTFEELRNDTTFDLFNKFRSNTRCPEGELMTEAQLRIVKGIEKICTTHPQSTVAVVSHSDVIKSALMFYAGMHPDMFQRIEISPASVSIIKIFPETATITLMNDTDLFK